jgi:hypothetical protein
LSATAAVELLVKLSRFAAATEYHKRARKTEAEGLTYTAAMQLRKAAGLFDHEEWLAESCWREWERIMQLPRQLSPPIV